MTDWPDEEAPDPVADWVDDEQPAPEWIPNYYRTEPSWCLSDPLLDEYGWEYHGPECHCTIDSLDALERLWVESQGLTRQARRQADRAHARTREAWIVLVVEVAVTAAFLWTVWHYHGTGLLK